PPEARKAPPKRPAPPKSEIRNTKSEIRTEPSKPAVVEQDLAIPLAPEPPPAPPLPPLEEDFGTDEDDGKPYRVAGTKGRKCPDWCAFMRPDEGQCPRCGFDLATGKKPSKSFTPVERSWEAGWPLRKRFSFFILGLALALASGLPVAYFTESWYGFVA